MTALDLSRWQFAITTLFHFIFVPMSIGLAAWVALLHTMAYRTGRDVYLRMTRFWGRLMLISFAVGVVTGIVQEFQFGMNWSGYSRYVGDVFGAPLAMEALAAFFLESTFLGLWIFGEGRISPRLHLASAWLLAFGSALSAYFILAANSWMQHPVGYELEGGRAVMTDIWEVLTNSTVLLAYPHTMFGAAVTAGMVILAVSCWNLLRGRHVDVFSRSARLVAPIVAVCAVLTVIAGHFQGVLMERQQPMKMAAAEALYDTEAPASFSIFATGDFERNPGRLNKDIRIPHALSILSDFSWNGKVKGINQIQREEVARYGPGDYVPVVGVTYWTFRLMVGAGSLLVLIALAGWLLAHRRRLDSARWFLRIGIGGAVLPVLANFTGWIFTEMGRQPWVVFGLLRTSDARSPHVGTTEIVLSLAGYTVVYGVLAAIGGWLAVREIRRGPAEPLPEGAPPDGASRPDLVLAY